MSKRAVAEQVVDKAQLFGAAETFSAITGRPSSNVASFRGRTMRHVVPATSEREEGQGKSERDTFSRAP